MPELLNRAEVCRFFGGTTLNASTLYRGIKARIAIRSLCKLARLEPLAAQ